MHDLLLNDWDLMMTLAQVTLLSLLLGWWQKRLGGAVQKQEGLVSELGGVMEWDVH